MVLMTQSVLFTNARLFAGTSDEVIEQAAIWVDGPIIRYAGRETELPSVPDHVRRVDLHGQFVMPGMTESHTHMSFTSVGPDALDKLPVEQTMVGAINNARIMLGAGFTSAISFGSMYRIDPHLRAAIERGDIPGPRLLASGHDMGGTGSNADLQPDHLKRADGLGKTADGPWEIRKAVRSMRKNGAQVVKLFLDGEGLCDYAPPGELTYTDEEVEAAISEAHNRNMRVATHSRSAAAVKQAVKLGADFIGHANFLDDEALDMLRKARGRVSVGPAIAWEVQFLKHHDSMGISRQTVRDWGYEREVEATVDAVRRLRGAGVRVLVGGDYGLHITPHGTYARDLEYFVDLFGMSSAEALLCATRDGGIAADPTGMLGTLEEGKYADLAIIDGDPVADIRVLQNMDRITAVMKGGKLYRGLARTEPHLASPDDLVAPRATRPATLEQVERMMTTVDEEAR